jgi:hypothetical protein
MNGAGAQMKRPDESSPRLVATTVLLTSDVHTSDTCVVGCVPR